MLDHAAVVDQTRQWIASVVIGLNLCPFAQRVFAADKIRYVVSDAEDSAALFRELAAELEALAAAPASTVETTLLIHPRALADFLDYNDFVGAAEHLVADLGLESVVQIAGFHPAYQFAETQPEDVENYTNRSPFPMLHLLREESITRVADDPAALEEIPRRNIETMRRLGLAKAAAMLQAVRRGPAS